MITERVDPTWAPNLAAACALAHVRGVRVPVYDPLAAAEIYGWKFGL